MSDPASPAPSGAHAPGDLPAYAMLAVALFAIGLGTDGQWVLVAPFMLASMLHPYLAGSIRLRVGFMGYLLLGVPFAILASAMKFRAAILVGSMSLAVFGCLYLILLAIIKLYSKPDASRLPRVLLAGGVTMTFMGVEVWSSHYAALVAVFAVSAFLMLRAGLARTRQRTDAPGKSHGKGALLAACVLVLLLAFIGEWAARTYYYDVQRMVMRYMMRVSLSPSQGFGERTVFGDIPRLQKQEANRRLALQAFADSPPGYLRGKAYVTYLKGEWLTLRQETQIEPERGPEGDARQGRVVLPGRQPAGENEAPAARIFPVPRYGAHFFLPLAACAFDTRSERVRIFAGNVFLSSYETTSLGYDVYTDGLPVTGGTADGGWLAVPENRRLRRALDKVLRGLAPSADSPAARVRALEQYFAKNYSYHMGIDYLTDADPMVEFLELARQGHCELFASAGTLLLRRWGVPARYITGFVCEEKNVFGRMYVARDRDAHAWVEYFDPVHGWRTAEFTPPEGVPGGGSASGWEAFLEYARALWNRTFAFGVSGAVRYLLETLGAFGLWLIGSWLRIALLVLLLGGFFAARLLHSRSRKARARRRTLPPELERMRRRFLDLERELSRLGHGRRDGETLLEYAARLECEPSIPRRDAVVEFTREFARQRYAPPAADAP